MSTTAAPAAPAPPPRRAVRLAEAISKIVWQSVPNKMDLSPAFLARQASLKRANPTWTFRLLDDATIQTEIAKWPSKLLRTYLSINPQFGAARADFWRYAVLMLHGGVYFDADVCLLQPLDSWLNLSRGLTVFFEPHPFPIDSGRFQPSTWSNSIRRQHAEAVVEHLQRMGVWPPQRSPLLAPNHPAVGPFVVAQWFIASPPSHPVLMGALQHSSRMLDKWKDTGVALNLTSRFKTLHITGPAMWTLAIRAYLGSARGKRHPPEHGVQFLGLDRTFAATFWGRNLSSGRPKWSLGYPTSADVVRPWCLDKRDWKRAGAKSSYSLLPTSTPFKVTTSGPVQHGHAVEHCSHCCRAQLSTTAHAARDARPSASMMRTRRLPGWWSALASVRPLAPTASPARASGRS